MTQLNSIPRRATQKCMYNECTVQRVRASYTYTHMHVTIILRYSGDNNTKRAATSDQYCVTIQKIMYTPSSLLHLRVPTHIHTRTRRLYTATSPICTRINAVLSCDDHWRHFLCHPFVVAHDFPDTPSSSWKYQITRVGIHNKKKTETL